MPIDTKRILSRRLGELLRQKGPDRITVTELVESCGLSRQAFYYHFQDIVEALEWGCEEKVKKIVRASVKAETIEEALAVYIRFFSEDRAEISGLLNSRLHDGALEMLTESIRSWLEALLLRERGAETADERTDFALDLYAGGMCLILLRKAGRSEEGDARLVTCLSEAIRGELKLF